MYHRMMTEALEIPGPIPGPSDFGTDLEMRLWTLLSGSINYDAELFGCSICGMLQSL